MMANQVRVDAALNNVRAAQQKLTYDPQEGYQQRQGAAAVQPNAQGQGLQDVYGAKLQSAIDDASSGLANDAQRQVFQQKAAQLSSQFDEQLQAHVLKQYQQFGMQTQQGTIDLASDAAQKQWNNPDAIDAQIESAKAAVWKAGQISGEPADLTQAKMLQTTSGIHMGVLDAALQNNNPGYAKAYLQQYRGDMTAGDLLKAQAAINNDLNTRTATAAAQGAISANQSAFTPSDADRMLQITRQAESGGQDLKADGTPVTSSAGAKYGMQVLDSTAAAPGHGIAPAASDTPAEYNRVGTQLLGVLVQKYAGDPAKAWAAYNAGEGNVDKAIKDAGQGGNWMDALAKYQSPENHAQTVAYVNGNVDKLNNGAGVPPMPTLAQVQQQAVAALGPNPDPLVAQKASDEAARQYNQMVESRKDQGNNAVQQVQQYLLQNKGDYTSVPPNLLAAVTQYAPQEVPNLRKFAQAVGTPTSDNMAAYHTAIEHPEELAAMPDAVFNQFAMTNFSPSTQKQIAKLRQDAQNGASDSAQSINAKAVTSELNSRLTSLGINAKPTDDAGRQQLGAVTKFVTDGIYEQQNQLGRKMTPQEITQYVDQQFLKNEQFRNTYMGIAGGLQSKPYLSMKVGDIPGDSLDAVRASLARAGNPNPSDDQILRTYWTKRMRGQVASAGASGNW
jgi:soluble lytic murein transglycosylase